MDQAAVLRELKANPGLPWTEVAGKLCLSKQRVLDLVGLLDLPDEIKEDIRQKKLTEKHGRALRQLLDQAEDLLQIFLFSSQKLIKILHKLNINSLKDREKEELKNNLREANKEIQKFIETF